MDEGDEQSGAADRDDARSRLLAGGRDVRQSIARSTEREQRRREQRRRWIRRGLWTLTLLVVVAVAAVTVPRLLRPSLDVAQTADEVAAIRGAAFGALPTVVRDDRDALAARAGFPDARLVNATFHPVLGGFGLLGAFDTQELWVPSSAGLLGLWTGEVVSVREDDPATVTALERYVLAHELTHALATQQRQLPVERLGVLPETATDADLAFVALVEGEAEYVARRWAAEHLTAAERSALDTEDSRLRADLPPLPYLVEAVVQEPYVSGLAYVERQLDAGRTIDELYEDPPMSTRELRSDDTPPTAATNDLRWLADVTAPDLGPSWPVDVLTLETLFEAPGGDPDLASPTASDDADLVAAGGMRVVGGAGALVDGVTLALVQREDRPTGQLCRAVTAWWDATQDAVGARRGVDGDIVVHASPRRSSLLRCGGRRVALVVAEDVRDLELISDDLDHVDDLADEPSPP